MDFNRLYNPLKTSKDSEQPEVLLTRLRPLIQRTLIDTNNYHPIYRLNHVFGTSHREEQLQFACRQVEEHYQRSSEAARQKIRILDVGCFFGFTTLTLAERFPKTVGCDINPAYIEASQILAAYHRSSARFCSFNVFNLDVPDHAIDCALFFNVLHQIIFDRGLAFVQAFLGRLAQVTDVMFLELATWEEYKDHPTEHPLPREAADVLVECRDCSIEFAQSVRPFYKVQRRQLQYFEMPIHKITFQGAGDPSVDKKNYTSERGFLKIFRHPENNEEYAQREFDGLQKVRRHRISPYPYEILQTNTYWSVLMERIDGTNLREHSLRADSPGVETHLLAKMLQILAVLAENRVYQNDFSLQNFILTSAGRLYLVDYEHLSERPLYDYFAFFLWNINDWDKGAHDSIRKNAFVNLVVQDGEARVDRKYYPDIAEFNADKPVRDVMEDALIAGDWAVFTRRWAEALDDA